MPLCGRPFEEIAKRLGIAEGECLVRIEALKKKGAIRHLAASLNHRKLGYKGTLIAARVSEEKVEALVAEIVGYPEVTHCYLREGGHNLWIAFLWRRRAVLEQFLKHLRSQAGHKNVLSFASRRQFKLKTSFRLD